MLGPPTGWSAARIVVTLSRDRPESSGKELWRFETGEELDYGQPPPVADGAVYVADTSDLFAVDAASGEELWRFETDERLGLGSPVAANGMVYVSDENTLYAMEQ